MSAATIQKTGLREQAYHRISLEDDHSTTFITSGQQISIMIEFYTRYDVGWNRQEIDY